MGVLKTLRTGLGLTQTEVSRRANIQISTYKRYELGINFPKMDALGRLADLYSMPVGNLYSLLSEDKETYSRMDELHIAYEKRKAKKNAENSAHS